jgi:putative ATP-binding cassette transporter
MVLIGGRLVQVSENKNQTEAEYRYAITRLRENGESIALIRGEVEERAGLDRSFGKVLAAWLDDCISKHEDDGRFPDLKLHRARVADHPLRA